MLIAQDWNDVHGGKEKALDQGPVSLVKYIWKKSFDQPRQRIKKQRRYFANKGLSSQSYGFSISHV